MLALIPLALVLLQGPGEEKGAPDRSLTSEAYVELGMPSPDREWTSKEYAKASSVLTKISKDDRCKLPRRDSKVSKEMWGRLCSPENLRIYRNQTLPIDSRLPMVLELGQAMKEIYLTYGDPGASTIVFDGEVIDLTILYLAISLVTMELAEEFQKGLLADDPKKEARERGRERMRNGLATQIHGALTMLEERSRYRIEELIRLARDLKDSLPKLLLYVTPLSAKEIAIAIKKKSEEEPHDEMKAALKAILGSLSNDKAGK